jgi:GT2 family glycosyltransferase
MMAAELTVTALVPSYGRPESLLRCLEALVKGYRPPDQIVIVLRDTDRESRHAVNNWLMLHETQTVDLVQVSEPGQIAAMNAGLLVATGDIICFPDDDCAPRRDWLQRVMSHFADPQVGGVGGRDRVHAPGLPPPPTVKVVGAVTWYGRIIGNHHCEVNGGPRAVQHLKGVNMSFRRALLPAFDPHIRGPHTNDTDISLAVRRQGYQLIYDPEAKVDHYPAQRLDNPGGRNLLDPRLVYLDSHDWMYLVLKHLPAWQKPLAAVYILLVGTRLRPGLLTGLGQALRRPREAWPRLVAVQRGAWAAVGTALRVRREVSGS